MKKILLTGANGYIGRRLKHVLAQDDSIQLRLMVRNIGSFATTTKETTQIVSADVLDPMSLHKALEGIDTAYYLIHGLDHGNFREIDRIGAQNFLQACIDQGVKRIIYLGGLGDKKTGSEHLLSRIETGEILSSRPDKVQCIWFRAGVIIGSGSASFEIIRNLVQKLPIMITPKWVRTLITPIGVDDIISYLSQGLYLETTASLMIDLGEETMSYGELMIRVANAMGLKRYLFPVNVLTPKLSSYWLALFTPVPFSVASSLIEGLKSEVIVTNTLQHEYFSIQSLSLEETVKRAISQIESNQVLSRWSDSGLGAWEIDHTHDIADALYIDRRIAPLDSLSAASVYQSFCKIGGKNGWFGYDWLWNVRGFIDKLFKGAGMNRGRRHPHTLRLGDSVDFWKVVDLVENERLLLFAQMKLPGKAWLEFKIHDGKLIQTAYFYPYGIIGRAYWYALIPLHYLIFTNMIHSLLAQAKLESA